MTRPTEHSRGEPDAVELSGADAQLVIRILEDWLEGRRRLLAIRDSRFLSVAESRRRKHIESEVGKVEWILGWWGDVGGVLTGREES